MLYSLDEIIAALKDAAGRPRVAAKALGVNPKYIHATLRRRPEWREAILAHVNRSKKPDAPTQHQIRIARALSQLGSVERAARALGVSISAIQQTGKRCALVRTELERIKQPRRLYTPHEVVQALRAAEGDVVAACERLHVCEDYIYAYMRDDPHAKAIIRPHITTGRRKQQQMAKVAGIVRALRLYSHTATAAKALSMSPMAIYQLAKRHKSIRDEIDRIKSTRMPITPEEARAALAQHGNNAGRVLGRTLKWIKEVAKRGSNEH